MLCNACNQDRHPVIEGDQSGRFVYTCGNSECHAFIKLHERSEPKAVTPAQPPSVVMAAPPSVPIAHPLPVPAGDALDVAMSALDARLAIVEAALAQVSALKDERARLLRIKRAAGQLKPRSAGPSRMFMAQEVMTGVVAVKDHQ